MIETWWAGFGYQTKSRYLPFSSVVPAALTASTLLPFQSADLPSFEFLPLGIVNPFLGMRITSPDHSTSVLPDGQSGGLQLRGHMLFTKHYNNPAATDASFVEDGGSEVVISASLRTESQGLAE
jgi:acyl-CoA synthetase (AMP-forming)/AMP-acid ligase II